MNILVIEDDAPVRDTIRDILELSGFDVIVAGDGVVGLEQLSKNPDLILCDLAMPRLDGFEVISAVRKNKTYASIPIIVLTAKTERSDLRRAMELGADDYITKPFTSKEVLSAIDARLQRVKPLQVRLEEYRELHENQFSASWGHELLTLLQGILGGADVLINEADNLSPSEIRDIALIIKRSGKREESLAKKILFHFELDRVIASGGKHASSPAIEASDILKEACIPLVQEADRLTDLDMVLAPGTMSLPKTWLVMVAEELVENAIKFSKKGTPIQVKGHLVNGNYRLEITNHGSTMTKEQIESIGPFVQFDRERKEQKGLGLGLSNLKKLAKIIHGNLELIPAPEGTGLMAVFSFPTQTG